MRRSGADALFRNGAEQRCSSVWNMRAPETGESQRGRVDSQSSRASDGKRDKGGGKMERGGENKVTQACYMVVREQHPIGSDPSKTGRTDTRGFQGPPGGNSRPC